MLVNPSSILEGTYTRDQERAKINKNLVATVKGGRYMAIVLWHTVD